MQPFIVIDTNILAERTRLLRTGLGPILVYLVKVRGTKIFLPEVIEIEVRRYVSAAVAALHAAVGSSVRGIREWVGEASDPRLPPLAEIDKHVDRRLVELSKWVQRSTTTAELIQRAAHRVFQKIAPSHRDGEDAFKDCLIWESILTMPRGTSVDFVTDDVRAFYDPENPQQLHPTLAAEAAVAEIHVQAHRDLESLIRKLQGSEPDLDRARTEAVLNAALTEAFIRAMQTWNLDAIEDGVFVIEPFVTEHPGLLYLEFSVECRVRGAVVLEEVRYESASVRLEGNCIYDPHALAHNVQVTRSSLMAGDGRELRALATGYLQASTSRNRPFQIRRSLKDTGTSADARRRKPK